MIVPASGGTPRNLTKSPGVADWSPDCDHAAGRVRHLRDVERRAAATEPLPIVGTVPGTVPAGRGETGPVELWRIGVDGNGARRLSTTAEPVFVFDWA